MPLKATDPHAKILILLALWDIGAAQEEVNKGSLTKRIVAKGGKIGDFQEVFDQLTSEDLMRFVGKKVFLPAKGMEYLSAGINNPEFLFKNQIGAKTGNSLLRWADRLATMRCPATTVAPSGATNRAISVKAVISTRLDKPIGRPRRSSSRIARTWGGAKWRNTSDSRRNV